MLKATHDTRAMYNSLLNLRTVYLFSQLGNIFSSDPKLLITLLGESRAEKARIGWGTSAKASGGLFWAIYDPSKTYLAVIWRNNQFWVKVFVGEFNPSILFPIHQALTAVARKGVLSILLQDSGIDIYYEVPISLWTLLNKKQFTKLLQELVLEIQVSFNDQAVMVLRRSMVPEAYAEEEFNVEEYDDVEED